ncbi:MAG: NAD-dependent epimerase/dehydratase family protein [Patescibacteria group bacterium]
MKDDIAVVTGGAGFIGSHIVDKLLAQGAHVRIVDTVPVVVEEHQKACEVFTANLLDVEVLARACNGARYVFHLAAVASVPKSMEDPLGTHRTNIDGTLAVFEAARLAGVSRVVYSSSSAVYGDDPTLPKQESMVPKPISPYALHKLVGEQYAALYKKVFGTEIVSLRYFNVFGPRQNAHSAYAAAIPLFVAAMREGKQPTVFGDGSATRDFVSVYDVVEANILAATTEVAVGEVLNIGCGKGVSILQVIAAINQALGTAIQPRFAPVRAGDIAHSVSDIGKARKLLGFEPKVIFEEGIKELVNENV